MKSSNLQYRIPSEFLMLDAIPCQIVSHQIISQAVSKYRPSNANFTYAGKHSSLEAPGMFHNDTNLASQTGITLPSF